MPMPTVDLLVVGAGFWGTACAVEARLAGLRVLLLDDANPRAASRNAAGIVCRHWYRQETIQKMTPAWLVRADLNRSIARLTQSGLARTGEYFRSYQREELLYREDCYLLPSPDAVLGLAAPTRAVVRSLREGPAAVTADTSLGPVRAARVAVAAGAYTDVLLSRSGLPPVGVTALRGRALLARGGPAVGTPVTYMPRPYTHYTLRAWGEGLVRLGDSVERGTSDGLPALHKNLQALCPGAAVSAVLDGVRPVCKTFTADPISPRVFVCTGGHRVGLALAWVVAWRLLEWLRT